MKKTIAITLSAAMLMASCGRTEARTADKVREVLSIMYDDTPDGLAGNEDVGQMSAWYILSSLGFYQVEPGSGQYWMGSPLFDKAVINTGPAKDRFFTIKTTGNSPENRYIQSMKLNGKTYTKGYIRHEDIVDGGILEIKMGREPVKWY